MATYFYSFQSYPEADLSVKGSIASYVDDSNGLVTIESEPDFSLNNGVVVGDVVKLYSSADNSIFIYGILTGKVGVVGGGWAISLSYDKNIYSDTISSMDTFLIYAKALTEPQQPYDEYITVNSDVSYAYRINARVETAAYSEQYIRYKVKTYYDLILDSTRRYFFEDFSNIATASNAIMVDDCASPNGVAYKVYMPETTFELFNNKFRKDVTFRIIA
jgi:hypothetical protein